MPGLLVTLTLLFAAFPRDSIFFERAESFLISKVTLGPRPPDADFLAQTGTPSMAEQPPSAQHYKG